jgi:predicted metal-dependent phosphoesterase TrpH
MARASKKQLAAPSPWTSAGGADLHAHTTCSDGQLTPQQLVAEALAADLQVLAITDHDSLDGIAAAADAAAGTGLEVVPGIEISCQAAGREVHLLGLFVDPGDAALNRLTLSQRESRRERATVIVERLRQRGESLTIEDIDLQAAGGPIGRPHVARAMLAAGIVIDMQSAFDRYLGIGRACFVPKRLPTAQDAIVLVREAGGVSVLAHPGSSRVRQAVITDLANAGLDGVEIRHPKHSRQREEILLALSRRLGLLPSGGSDFHGPGRQAARLGQYRVPVSWSENLRQRAHERSGRRRIEESPQ